MECVGGWVGGWAGGGDVPVGLAGTGHAVHSLLPVVGELGGLLDLLLVL